MKLLGLILLSITLFAGVNMAAANYRLILNTGRALRATFDLCNSLVTYQGTHAVFVILDKPTTCTTYETTYCTGKKESKPFEAGKTNLHGIPYWSIKCDEPK